MNPRACEGNEIHVPDEFGQSRGFANDPYKSARSRRHSVDDCHASYAAKSNNAAAKLSLEQPNVYPTGASAGQVPSRTKASKMTVPLIVAGVAVVVGAAVLLGQNGSTPASR